MARDKVRSGEIPGIPPGLQMLHVEQEAAGVDETALQVMCDRCSLLPISRTSRAHSRSLQVVLAVDEERNGLLQLERQLQSDARCVRRDGRTYRACVTFTTWTVTLRELSSPVFTNACRTSMPKVCVCIIMMLLLLLLVVAVAVVMMLMMTTLFLF